MAKFIEIRRDILVSQRLQALFKVCTPKLLVVTDNLSFSPSDDFGLSQFTASLAARQIYGMTPTIVKASRRTDPTADIPGFTFNHPTHGVKIGRYDVVFMLGFDREFTAPLDPNEVQAMVDFMQAGGGVFATGDHEDLGASMGAYVPRVRSMRYWTASDTPDIGDTTRLSTNLPGANDVYEMNDQADVFPQRLYVNYRTNAGGVGNPHPLLQSTLGPIEVFPDHPHEGECHLPTDLTTRLPDKKTLEWPEATAGSGTVLPEVVALSMSHGDAFSTKAALVPRSFIAICAYDGQLADVGRVVTDATWHHFVNVNIDGTGTSRSGLQDPPGTDTPEMAKIRQYYGNLATWLMPKKVRMCLRTPWLLHEFARFPLFEELRLPDLETASGEELRAVGEQVTAALEQRYTHAEAAQLAADALEEGLGADFSKVLSGFGQRFGDVSASKVGLAALGAVAVATVAVSNDLRDVPDADPEKHFPLAAQKAARDGAARYVAQHKEPLKVLLELLGKLGR